MVGGRALGFKQGCHRGPFLCGLVNEGLVFEITHRDLLQQDARRLPGSQDQPTFSFTALQDYLAVSLGTVNHVVHNARKVLQAETYQFSRIVVIVVILQLDTFSSLAAASKSPRAK